MALSPEERQRIELEEKTRLEVPPGLQAQTKKTDTGTVIGLSILGILVFYLLIVFIGSIAKNSDQRTSIRSSPPTATTGSSPPTSAIQSTGNATHDHILALGASAQALVLGEAVNEGCSGEYAFYMGMVKETKEAFWSVRCTNGKSYEVQIKPDAAGTARYLDCDILKAVAKVSCFARFNQR
jgi:hypothetical protein